MAESTPDLLGALLDSMLKPTPAAALERQLAGRKLRQPAPGRPSLIPSPDDIEPARSVPPMPKAWADLLAGLILLAIAAANETSPLHCEHDTLYVQADPERLGAESLAQLEAWGFYPAEGEPAFYSYRFGSA